MKFRAIMGGLTPIKVNGRLRELWEEVAAIRTAIADLEEIAGVLPSNQTNIETISTPAVTTPPATDTASGQPADVPEVPAPDAFDWETSESVESLKAFALEKFNLVSRKKRPDTIREEIRAILEVQQGD